MAENGETETSRLVLVPVANPATADDLLSLASSLINHDTGKIIALMVSVGDIETDSVAKENLEEICDEFEAQGIDISLVTQVSTSISRGILDFAREVGADLLVLGLQRPTRGQVVVGAIAESCIQAAPCDVLIYRAAKDWNPQKVIVPIDGHSNSSVAARVGITISQHYGIPIDATYVRHSGQSYYEAAAHIEHVLIDIPHQRQVNRRVLEGRDTAKALASRINENDLTVVGFDDRTDLELWLFGGYASDILNRAEGPVVLVSQSARVGARARVQQRVMSWLRPVLTKPEIEDITRQAKDNSYPTLDFMVLIVVSAIIATLGLLSNSAAVIIGAMLVAPLMSPLISISTGLTQGRFDITSRALITLFEGIIVALLVAIATGTIFFFTSPTSEMLSRGSPTLIDAGIAFVSGFVGAYATARKHIPAALAGVAIAAALMPPLCTVGLGISISNDSLALGAGLLFLTNIVCIILAGVIVFLWLGVQLDDEDGTGFIGVGRFASLAMLTAMVVIVVMQLIYLNGQDTLESIVYHELQASIPNATVDVLEVSEFENVVEVAVAIIFEEVNAVTDVDTAHDNLERVLQKPVRLSVLPQAVIQFQPSGD